MISLWVFFKFFDFLEPNFQELVGHLVCTSKSRLYVEGFERCIEFSKALKKQPVNLLSKSVKYSSILNKVYLWVYFEHQLLHCLSPNSFRPQTFEAYTLNREWMGQKLRQEASKRRMRLLIVIEAASFRGSTTFTASTFLFPNRKLCLF